MNRKGCTSPLKEREETRKEKINKKANVSYQPNQLKRNLLPWYTQLLMRTLHENE